MAINSSYLGDFYHFEFVNNMECFRVEKCIFCKEGIFKRKFTHTYSPSVPSESWQKKLRGLRFL